MVQLLHSLLEWIQPTLVPLCFISAWALVILVFWNIWSFVQDAAKRTHQMHQVPCANCQFFTNNYRLKCTVHPSIALSEQAIGCSDYVSANQPCRAHQS